MHATGGTLDASREQPRHTPDGQHHEHLGHRPRAHVFGDLSFLLPHHPVELFTLALDRNGRLELAIADAQGGRHQSSAIAVDDRLRLFVVGADGVSGVSLTSQGARIQPDDRNLAIRCFPQTADRRRVKPGEPLAFERGAFRALARRPIQFAVESPPCDLFVRPTVRLSRENADILVAIVRVEGNGLSLANALHDHCGEQHKH
mmetsp:Transcript_69624/g.202042  ORF Transcript_69624/g.202042 Transcript_69624/m.202042 type:complete len:203 (+) Transcript_69624:48-656(+)